MIVAMMSANAGDSKHEPSAGAEGMPGAEGTFEFKPADWVEGEMTWWLDSDGIDPGEAGCHTGADGNVKPNGRMSGEACLESGLLVESNPGEVELHSHKNDTGHPDTFDCKEFRFPALCWCQVLVKGPQSEHFTVLF